MFKKRLKGLLAMVLAGSIATTTLPLSASATISGNISVLGGIGGTINSSDIEGGLDNYRAYLTADNLWAIHNNAGYYNCAGDELQSTLQRYSEVPSTVSDIKIRYSHDIFFTTADFSGGTAVTRGDMDNLVSVASFPYNISYAVSLPVDPLKETTWTAWYNSASGNEINPTTYEYTSGNCTKSSTFVDQTSTQISADVIKELYQGSNEEPITCGKTIIELKTTPKTFNLPVLNAVGAWERNPDNSIKTIPITNENGDIDGGNEFYLCYGDGSFKKISDGSVDNKPALWTYINSFATTIDGFNPSKLYLLRDVLVKVDGDGTDGEFTSKDLFECEDGTTTNAALSYMLNAKPKSIWKIVPSEDPNLSFYTYQTGITSQISDYLRENPGNAKFTLTEQTSVYVTGEDPTANGEIPDDSCFGSPLLKDNGSPATFSDHAATLADNQAPQTGKKYDTTGWQLWKGAFTGTVFEFDSQIAVGTGVNSIGIEQLEAAGGYKLIIYFPQVDDTSSGGGSGSSGGSSSSREPSYDPDKPMIDGEEKSWSDVAKEIGKLGEGETKTIVLGGDKKIPADVMQAIKDSKAVITFKINSAFSWTVDGSTLTDGDIHDYDFSIELITAEGTEIIRGMVGVGFKIGEVTDKATLNINFKIEHAQEFANLYKMVDGELVFVDNVKIDENGAAIGLEVTEAGDYVVMLGKMSDRPGDMDNDGIMNAKDSLAILKDFLGIESGANPLVSDMNGDSFINAKDALIIVKKSVGIE
ncbi:MAG: dockerin type I domain-containing protein [Oscillospiraceae bacterium]